jgi:mRNA interferase RelE/StbE
MGREVAVFYTAHARKDLLKIDAVHVRAIVHKIEENTALEDPLSRAKLLSGALAGLYRYRVGEYRVIFETNDQGTVYVLTILRVKHRKDVYRSM